MSEAFTHFVVLAEMRTGSNFLEENINEYPGLHSHGEVFNPHFIGHAKQTALCDMTLSDREADPLGFWTRVRERSEGIPGFRYFHDHDPRVLEPILKDRSCAKIVLTRNALESYVSLKIAGATGQWRLGDMRQAKTAKASFDAAEFELYLAERQAFQLRLLNALQVTGQTAFFIDYEDIQDIDVLNGLARYLGCESPKKALSTKTKKQNPSAIEDKIANFAAVEDGLAKIDAFGLGRTPNFEPRRAPVVPNYIAGVEAPLLFMPIRGSVQSEVTNWLAALDRVQTEELTTGFSQKTLRHWKRHHPGHRSFTVIRHPAARAHAAFLKHILIPGPDCFAEIRRTLRTSYKVPMPEGAPDEHYDKLAHRTAFMAFLAFLKGNLSGQTSVRVDGSWASQETVIRGFAEFATPDMILREETLVEGLTQLCAQVGRQPAPIPSPVPETPFALADIYDDALEGEVRSAYQRDYMMFGFRAWR